MTERNLYYFLSFIKKTQKTPLREIAKAIKLMNEYKRGEVNEKG